MPLFSSLDVNGGLLGVTAVMDGGSCRRPYGCRPDAGPISCHCHGSGCASAAANCWSHVGPPYVNGGFCAVTAVIAGGNLPANVGCGSGGCHVSATLTRYADRPSWANGGLSTRAGGTSLTFSVGRGSGGSHEARTDGSQSSENVGGATN